MFKTKSPGFRICTLVGSAAFGALSAGKDLHHDTPSPKQTFGIGTVTGTTSAAGSAVIMNTIGFNVVVVTPPSDGQGQNAFALDDPPTDVFRLRTFRAARD
jgi:hypothetical protein